MTGEHSNFYIKNILYDMFKDYHKIDFNSLKIYSKNLISTY